MEDKRRAGGTALPTTARTSRQRQKHEAQVLSQQIADAQRQIARLHEKLSRFASVQEIAEAHNHVAMENSIAFLNDKLAAHRKWESDLRVLLGSAPLLDFALRVQDVPKDVEAAEEDTLKTALMDWQREARDQSSRVSPVLIARQMQHESALSQENAFRLLEEFARPACAFAVQFTTRGWELSANVTDKLLAFRAHREMASVTASAIASALWKALQQDNVLRTFAPVVQDASVFYEWDSPNKSIVGRVLQVETASGSVDSVVTVESRQDRAIDGLVCVQIVLESCDDPCLLAFAKEVTRSESATTGASAPVAGVVDTGVDVVVAVRSYQTTWNGVRVELAGSILYTDASAVPAKTDLQLVQHLASMMPVFEELVLLAKQ